MRLLALNHSVGRRLLAAFGLVCVLLGAVVAAGIWGQQAQGRSRQQLAGVRPVRGQLQRLRYLDADVSGWQAYLYMHATVEGVKTTDPGSSQVQGIMADKAVGSALLARLSALPLAPAAKASLDK